MKPSPVAIPLEQLLERLPDTFSPADRELVQRAYRVAEEAHREQKRNSGALYQPLSRGCNHPGRPARAARSDCRRPAA